VFAPTSSSLDGGKFADRFGSRVLVNRDGPVQDVDERVAHLRAARESRHCHGASLADRDRHRCPVVTVLNAHDESGNDAGGDTWPGVRRHADISVDV
jgi:hypothetical protein